MVVQVHSVTAHFIVAGFRCRVSYNQVLYNCGTHPCVHLSVHSIRKSVLVAHSATRMFDLVADVSAYPHFMPWCGGASAHTQNDGAVRARIDIRFGGVKSAFTTLNRHRIDRRIDMEFVDGPFTVLTGHWDFYALTAEACKVEFALDYEFAGGLIGRVIAPVFDVIAASFVDTFSARAEALYG